MKIHGFANRAIAAILCSVMLFACGGGGSNDIDPVEQEREARAYLSQVLTIMRENALTRNEVDWGSLETEVNQLAVNAKSIRDTYPAITRALQLINTNHSFLADASGNVITYPSTLRCNEQVSFSQPNVEGIGYIRVDGFLSGDSDEANLFANNIQARIAEQDSEQVNAWIVDLRENTGGNMWPMIAGLGPLFEGTIQGHFIDPNEEIIAWGYNSRASYLGENNIVVINQPYTLINPLPKIAVLSSKRAGSSGEATLIAFKKQFNTRFFGNDSCGLSTANTSYALSDGSALVLTTAVMADRDQIKYGGPVLVDQQSNSTETIAQAIAWLQE